MQVNNSNFSILSTAILQTLTQNSLSSHHLHFFQASLMPFHFNLYSVINFPERELKAPSSSCKLFCYFSKRKWKFSFPGYQFLVFHSVREFFSRNINNKEDIQNRDGFSLYINLVGAPLCRFIEN